MNAYMNSPVESNMLYAFLGHYCPEGSAQPSGCPAGESQPNEGQWACVPCPAGFYCISSTIPDPLPCTSFHYCPEGRQTLSLRIVLPCWLSYHFTVSKIYNNTIKFIVADREIHFAAFVIIKIKNTE